VLEVLRGDPLWQQRHRALPLLRFDRQDHFRLHDTRRWKCYGCRSTFGVTTGTIFDRHKLSLRELLIGTLTWINSSAGQPALELKRHVDKTYNTAFTLQHKLREALMRGYNVGLLNGDVEK
jgi:transposase-like protein